MLGERAWELLCEGAEAAVLGRTSRALFLEVAGEALWIEGPTGTLHRRAVVAEALPAWEAGEVVPVSSGGLGPSPGLPLAPGRIWRSPPLPRPQADLAAGAQALLAELQGALEPIRDVVGREWVEKLADAAGIAEWGRRWIGVGPGLTPLGDDLLGGALFALRVLGRDGQRGEELVGWAWGRTTRLSGWLLADLSGGQGPEPLHRLAEALCGGDVGRARAHTRDLIRLGHSTGRALLGGALVVWAGSGGKGKG